MTDKPWPWAVVLTTASECEEYGGPCLMEVRLFPDRDGAKEWMRTCPEWTRPHCIPVTPEWLT